MRLTASACVCVCARAVSWLTASACVFLQRGSAWTWLGAVLESITMREAWQERAVFVGVPDPCGEVAAEGPP